MNVAHELVALQDLLHPGEVVAICDHLLLFPIGQPENKILREAAGVAFDLLVEAFGGDAVDRGSCSGAVIFRELFFSGNISRGGDP